jgi:hypothetical protein
VNFFDSLIGHVPATQSPSTEPEPEQHRDLHALSASNAEPARGLSTGLPSALEYVGAPSGDEFDSAGGAGVLASHQL